MKFSSFPTPPSVSLYSRTSYCMWIQVLNSRTFLNVFGYSESIQSRINYRMMLSSHYSLDACSTWSYFYWLVWSGFSKLSRSTLRRATCTALGSGKFRPLKSKPSLKSNLNCVHFIFHLKKKKKNTQAAHRLDQLPARRADLPGADRVAATHQAGAVRPADTVLPRASQLVRAAGRRAGAASGRWWWATWEKCGECNGFFVF